MGFIRDIRRDFKADCDKYGKAAIYFLVLAPICGILFMFVYTFCGEVISQSIGPPLEAAIGIWVVAAEKVPPPYRGPCFFGSVVLLLAVGLVTPVAYEGLELIRRRRPATVLRVALAVVGMFVVYGLFAVAVLCIDGEGCKLLVFGQAVLSFAAVIYATVRVTAAPIFE